MGALSRDTMKREKGFAFRQELNHSLIVDSSKKGFRSYRYRARRAGSLRPNEPIEKFLFTGILFYARHYALGKNEDKLGVQGQAKKRNITDNESAMMRT